MSPFEQLESSSPVPPVSVDDMKRVWRMVHKLKAEAGAQHFGIGERLIAEQCEPGANFQAVFFRVALLQYLFQAGLLDEWREDDGLSDSVFQVSATFPMELGDRGFDSAAFTSRLHAL